MRAGMTLGNIRNHSLIHLSQWDIISDLEDLTPSVPSRNPGKDLHLDQWNQVAVIIRPDAHIWSSSGR